MTSRALCRLFVPLAAALFSLTALPASAGPLDGPAALQTDRYGWGHWAAEVQAGLGTPIGAAGVAFDFDVLRDFSINLGGGWGFGPQFAAQLRLRRGRPPMRWGAALGASRGRAGTWLNDWLAGNETYGAHWNPGYWINFELFLESRADSGFRWRCFLGGGAVVNVNDCRWETQDYRNGTKCTKSFPLPYLGCSVGIGR